MDRPDQPVHLGGVGAQLGVIDEVRFGDHGARCCEDEASTQLAGMPDCAAGRAPAPQRADPLGVP
jgi:hypothetical protein